MPDMSEKQRIIIVSLDAVGKRDMEFMLSLPNFSKLVQEGAFCDNVTSVYPSLTYTAHATIVTGKTPDHHRIVANTCFQPSRSNPDWLYKEKYIKGETIVDLARKKKMSIATLLWPVMGGAKVNWNIPEVMVTRKYQNQVTACVANGTPLYLLDVNKRFGHLRKGTSQPELDDFLMATAEYTIDKYDPDMMLIHLVDVDTNRHNYGVDTPEIREALKRHDERLGKLLEWLENRRSMEKTTVIVLGDHCQIDTHTIVYLNKLFMDKGYLTVRDGKITDYKVIAKTCDGSTYVYLNPKYAVDETFMDSLTETLNEIKQDDRLGIEEIYTREEAKAMGADSECLVMIEGKRGYYFLNESDTLTEKVSETKNHKMLAIHGCLNTKEENKTFFLMNGYGVNKGVRIPDMNLWDEGPTIAKLMGETLPEADGRVVEEFLTP